MKNNLKILPNGIYFIKGDELDLRRMQRNRLIRFCSLLEKIELFTMREMLKDKSISVL